MSYGWRLVLATTPLMRALVIVMVPKAFRHGFRLFERSWAKDLDALFGVGSVVAFHVTVQFWMVRRQNVGLDANAPQELEQR